MLSCLVRYISSFIKTLLINILIFFLAILCTAMLCEDNDSQHASNSLVNKDLVLCLDPGPVQIAAPSLPFMALVGTILRNG